MVLGVRHTIGRLLFSSAVILLSSAAILSVIASTRARSLVQSPTIDSLSQAIALDPENVSYWVKRADLKQIAGMDPAADLLEAAARNPHDAAVWIQLGLNAERQGDMAAAEKSLLRSTAVSKLYQPRWTLANFYLRRNSQPEFWRWIRKALDVGPPDCRDSVFQLCWRVAGPNASEVVGNAIPNDPNVLQAYTQFLLATNRLTPAEASLKRVYAGALPTNPDLLLTAADKFLEHGMAEPALEAWNVLSRSGRSGALNPREGNVITNSDFSRKQHGHGFDWHIHEAPGVSGDIEGKLLAVSFSRPQPETHQVIWQYVPLIPQHHYEFQFEYRTAGIPPQSGIAWQVSSGQSPSTEIVNRDLQPSDTWRRESVQFTTPAATDLGRVSLGYSRSSGAPKISGSVLTRTVMLTPLR